MIRAIVGIDAAWIEHEPSELALIQSEGVDWSVVCVAPSYDAFIASSRGAHLQWEARKFRGTWPNIAGSMVRRLALARGGAADAEHLHESADEFFLFPEDDLVFWPRRDQLDSPDQPDDSDPSNALLIQPTSE